MRLPKEILTETYTKPRLFLCETDKTTICQLENTNMNGKFKFNSISELNFDVARVYTDTVTGETKVNPFYDRIESPRLVYLEGFAYFELQAPDLVGDGNKEIKTCMAYSSEYALSTKFLSNFYINTGEIDSVEVLYANGGKIVPVTFCNPENEELSLLHLVLQGVRGWKIGHVDRALQKLSRKFEVSRQSVYDFIMNEICDKFNCYVIFDTINNTINFYAESLTSKFIGDGTTNTFTVSPPFSQISTVSVDGYKTTRWAYNSDTGELTLTDTPRDGVMIEVVDGALTAWETDVFITFDNLAQEINLTYDADSIKTVLSVTYGDDCNIREANLGMPYLMDLSYYHTPEWMGPELYEKYKTYLQATNEAQAKYSTNVQKIVELSEKISNAKNRTSIGYGIDHSVNKETIGTYYVVSGGIYPNYTYSEVSLPDDYNANTVYYKLDGVNITEEKVHKLYSAVRKYFLAVHKQYEPEIKDIATYNDTWEELLEQLTDSFSFVSSQFDDLKNALTLEASVNDATNAFRNFLDLIWGELGATPLDKLFLAPYKEIQTVNVSAGYAQANSEHYWFYYPLTIMVESLEDAISIRNKEIDSLEANKKQYEKASSDVANRLAMENYFTEDQLIRLDAFMREDEVHFDDIVETVGDISNSFAIKQDAVESGRIELNKLCQPQLQFSMDMANIYALPEFEPIINQFQLGNVIKVGLRSDYIKQSRLLEVNINFDDFSDFSCEFGELTSLRSQSDIHADLLSQAISAGKNVASNAPLWTSGADKATKTDLKIEQGLLDAVTQIKAIDGTQGAVIDKYGIKLQRQLEDGSIDPEQVWLVNNQFVFTDDNFKTARSALGKVTVDGNTYYGLISEIVLSGYIEGSKMVGGTINIGDGAFVVHEDGSVTMNGGNTINGYAKEEDVNNKMDNMQEQINNISGSTPSNMYRIEVVVTGPTIISTPEDTATMTCKVYSWDADVTDTIDASMFNWKRTSNNAEQDAIWNGMPEHQGVKSITIDADDVIENSSFTCEVELPE